MSYSTYKYIPELDYIFKNYWKTQIDLPPLDTYIKLPELEYNTDIINRNSFFEILFNNNFDNTSDNVKYLFSELNSQLLSPCIFRRLKYNNIDVITYISDESGNTDIFNIGDQSSISRQLIDEILSYKLTGNILYSENNLYGIYFLNKTIFNGLLIRHLLLLQYNKYISNIDFEINISNTCSLFEQLYNLYLNVESYKMLKNDNIDVYDDVSFLQLRPYQIKINNPYENMLSDSDSDCFVLCYKINQNFPIYVDQHPIKIYIDGIQVNNILLNYGIFKSEILNDAFINNEDKECIIYYTDLTNENNNINFNELPDKFITNYVEILLNLNKLNIKETSTIIIEYSRFITNNFVSDNLEKKFINFPITIINQSLNCTTSLEVS